MGARFLIPAARLLPVLGDLRGYDLRRLRSDFLAGLTVAVVAVPQSMAYAVIAGVPVEYGLYTLVIQGLLGALFCSHPLLSGGPINTQSLLVASTVSRLVSHDLPPHEQAEAYLQLVTGLTLVKGLMQIVMAGLRLGSLVRYVSLSVLVGFTAGAGVLIAAGQVNWFLGFEAPRSGHDWPGVIGVLQRLGPHLALTRWESVAVGLLSLAVVVGARAVSRLAPGPLLAVVAAALVAALAGWSRADLPLVPAIPLATEGLHLFRLPRISWGQADALAGGALALSFLGLMEAYSIGKTLAARTGHPINANQELFAQGLTNALSSFFQCIPGSSSFTRSALNHFAGGQTRVSSVFNALLAAAIFVTLAPLAGRVPMASLAAVLFVVAWGLIDWRYLGRIYRASRSEAVVCLLTFALTLTVPLQYAILLGVFLNIGLYLQRASRLRLAEVEAEAGGAFVEHPISDRAGQKRVLLLQADGDLFFGVADQLQSRLGRIAQQGVPVVILRLRRTYDVDPTVMNVLEQFVRQMQESGRHVLLCGVRAELFRRMEGFGLVGVIGRANVFLAGLSAFSSARQALARARHLVGASIDVSGLQLDDDAEGWAYQI